MKEKNAAPRKTKGKGSSLVWRLTSTQLARSFFQILLFDALVAILFLCGMAVLSEQRAARAAPLLLRDQPAQTELLGAQYRLAENQIWGAALPSPLERHLGLPEGTARHFVSHTDPNSLQNWLLSADYTVGIPASDTGRYLHITFDWMPQIRVFSVCFLGLLAVQALGWLSSIFRINRSVQRSLQPIYELTRTARTIQAEPARQLAPEELHLSGAIETLNAITENKLDTRIVIADEREELRGLATAINEMLDRLDAAYQSQLRFVSDASHELRTPIAVVQGYANMLSRWGKDDEKTLLESIEAIKSEAASMQDLVEQLLFLARSDNNSIVLSAAELDLSALAQEVLSETMMIDKGHVYSSSLTPGLMVCGDAQLLKQALRIFVDNAIKYTPPGEHIVFSSGQEGNLVKLSVTDNGIGIPEEDLPFVFERFFRSDQSRARKTGGTGLGLSIAKWIVDRHGGHVELLSRSELGTRVTLVLPAV